MRHRASNEAGATMQRANENSDVKTKEPSGGTPHIVPPDDSTAARKARQKLAREHQAYWKPFKSCPNSIDILHKPDCGRMKELLAIRYGRMLQSPFALYRGSAGIMASDKEAVQSVRRKDQALGRDIRCRNVESLRHGMWFGTRPCTFEGQRDIRDDQRISRLLE
jgi:hypothetical protein